MNKLHKILFAFCIFTLVGCDNFLDLKPKGYTIPENFDDYVKLMNNQSFYFGSYSFMNYITDDMQLGDDSEYSGM
ncbi:MAG: hypothetical protein ACRCZQ_00545, partial [Bacteroidales bacterium]